MLAVPGVHGKRPWGKTSLADPNAILSKWEKEVHVKAHCLRRWLLAAVILVGPATAVADVVTEWNQQTQACTTQSKQLPVFAARTMAIVHTAMFDAVNSIENHYTPYRVKVPAPAGSSSEAAAIAAAHAALVELCPNQKAALDAAYTASLAKIT